MKKLQVFISSTYTDLIDERQAAVEAVLDAGHIPAGMELFKAGNDTQLSTIKRWIDESDVYLLILGGRYGSIEKDSGKSYTHLEYEYAINTGKPVFAVVLNENYIYRKAIDMGMDNIKEKYELEKYEEFKKIVLGKIVRMAEDIKDIKLAIYSTLPDFITRYKLHGWVRGNEVENSTSLLKENAKLLKQLDQLKIKISKLEKAKDDKIGNYSYQELKEILKNKEIVFPSDVSAKVWDSDEKVHLNYFEFVSKFKNNLSIGITNRKGIDEMTSFVYYHVLPTLMAFSLLDKVKVAGATYEKIQASKDGLKFFAKIHAEQLVKA